MSLNRYLATSHSSELLTATALGSYISRRCSGCKRSNKPPYRLHSRLPKLPVKPTPLQNLQEAARHDECVSSHPEMESVFLHTFVVQEAQLSQRDRAMLRVILHISLSYSRSLKVIKTGTIRKRGTVSYSHSIVAINQSIFIGSILYHFEIHPSIHLCLFLRKKSNQKYGTYISTIKI